MKYLIYTKKVRQPTILITIRGCRVTLAKPRWLHLFAKHGKANTDFLMDHSRSDRCPMYIVYRYIQNGLNVYSSLESCHKALFPSRLFVFLLCIFHHIRHEGAPKQDGRFVQTMMLVTAFRLALRS